MGARAATDRFLGFLCRRILAIYFREIEVVGERHLPRGAAGRAGRGPLVAVANHVNGLIDPLFVMGTLRLPARMLGKSTLWKIPVLAQILDIAGVIPVYRRQDEGVDPAKNLETFARCHEELAKGGAIAIFPEGISHDRPSLQPLKTGAARIALEAEARFGPLGCRIVPIGLHFEARERFRSRALVVVGEPLGVAEEAEVGAADPVTAVRLLTERVAEALERVTLNYSSWEEARLVERGARILEIDALELPRERRLATEFDARRDLLDGLAWLRDRHAAEVEAAAAAASDYDRLLSATGLRDEQVVASYPIERIAGYLARQLFRAAIAVAPAVAGTLLYALPYGVVAAIAHRVRHEPNQVATYKVFPGIAIYPLWTAGLALAAWRLSGGGAALATMLLAPLAGLVAVSFHERLERLWLEARAFLLLKGRKGLAEELRRRRVAADEKIDRLVQLWVESQAFHPDSR
jgi:1-acyl-sn-glycerol-3-phosphate acyltransferase